MSYGEKGRSEGHKYEDLVVERANQLYENSAVKTGDNLCKRAHESKTKTRSKTDLVFLGKNISLKNPGKDSASIQMFVTTQKVFTEAFNLKGTDIEVALRLLYGTPYEEEFERLLVECGIEKEDLDWENEVRRKRLLFSSLPQQKQTDLLSFFENNKRSLVESVFKKGWSKDFKAHADFMLWSESSVAGKTSLDHMCLFDMKEVINKICEYDWFVRPSAVLVLGPLTLQIKGSGNKKTWSYHDLQFNASLNDLKKHGIPYISGNSKYIFDYLAAK